MNANIFLLSNSTLSFYLVGAIWDPLPAECDGSHNRARRTGQSAMANTAPAYGARRRCRERGEAGQLLGSRNTRTLTPAPERRRRSLPNSSLAARCVSIGSA